MLEVLPAYFAQAPAFGLNAFWISQGLIGLALVSDVISYQMKRREHVLGFFVVSRLLIALHLYLREQPTAAALLGLAAVRFFVSIFTTRHEVMYFFLALSTILTFILYSSWLDIWAWACNVIFTFASFRPNDKQLRQTMMGGTSLWIGYNLFIFSPAAVLLESIFLTSNLVGYYRYYIRSAKTWRLVHFPYIRSA